MKRPIPSRRQRRGSAMIELSITLATFIVPVILYSNYISEALWYGLKAQEATAAAAWSFTGRLLHDYGGTSGTPSYNHTAKYSAAAISVRQEINTLYKGLDAFAVAGEKQSPTQSAGVATKAQLMAGSVCSPSSATVTDPSDLSKSSDPLIALGKSQMSTLGQDLHTGGLVSCQAQVQVTNWLLGKATGQNTMPLPVAGASPSANNLWPSTLLGSIQLCGVGAAVNSSCQNTGQTFTLYTDDWGLAEDGDSKGNDDQTNYQDYNQYVNNQFANLGQAVYEQEALPIPYDGTAQAALWIAPMAFCTNEDFVFVPNLFDKQYVFQAPHNSSNVAYRRADAYSGATPMNLSLDQGSPDDQFESSITQDSYTWPVRHYAAGKIGANAYRQMEDNRKDTYLSQ